jgi:hypothetical protein
MFSEVWGRNTSSGCEALKWSVYGKLTNAVSCRGRYRVRQKNLMIFKLKSNEKYTIFLCEFVIKIIFISKHVNYNIHFLNIVSVRRRPLLTHSPKRFWKFCISRCSILGEIAAISSLMFCFKSKVVLGFFSYTLLLRYPQRKKYCDRGHSFRWILKCRRNINWVTTTESLFLKIVSTAKTRRCTDQCSMATKMLCVLLEGHSRTNFPRQRFHSQLYRQIIRYFCRTLYILMSNNIMYKTNLNWCYDIKFIHLWKKRTSIVYQIVFAWWNRSITRTFHILYGF